MSVVVPFYGDRRSGEDMLAALEALRLTDGDELIVVDNTPEGVLAGVGESGGARVIAASAQASSYYARNVGVEHARNEWLLFIDADCVPPADLLDAYFAEPIADRCGALAGDVVGRPEQRSIAARYARSRHHLEQNSLFDHPYRPMIVTANVLVRRTAWESIGGFQEGIRSAGDSDFSWRLQDAGWELGVRVEARVEHLHRERLTALLRQAARYGGGGAWARRRHPDYPRPRVARELGRSLAGIVVWTITGQFERALFKGIDGLWVLSVRVGELFDNVAARPLAAGTRRAPDVLVLDTFPEAGGPSPSEADVVDAGSRPLKPDWKLARNVDVGFLEDVGTLSRARAITWLLARHPLRTWRSGRVERGEAASGSSLWQIAPRARRLSLLRPERLISYRGSAAAADARRLERLIAVPLTLVTPLVRPADSSSTAAAPMDYEGPHSAPVRANEAG